MARQWGQPTLAPDGIWHYPYTDPETGLSGEELSYEGPTGTTQPVSPTAPTATSQGAPGTTYLYPGTPSPAWWNAPTNPWSIGAGTSEQGYGWGVPGFGQDPIQILTAYLPYLQQQATGQRGGYIPGSGTYNQWNLSQPGLVGTVGGVPNMNLQYGSGSRGDPTTGQEAQTPEQWVQGGPLFTSTYSGNFGDTADTQGLSAVGNLFRRADTPSGISTAAWSAPKPYWDQLAQVIAKGWMTPTERGWQALAAKGYTPQSIGGAAAGAAGAAGAGGALEGAYASIIAMQQAQLAAQIAYQEWQMRTGDENLAMEKAQQAWSQKFQEVGQAFAQRATTAGITGQWDGQDTMAMQQQKFAQDLANRTFAEQQLQNQNATGLGLLQAQSALQGPRDWAKYWQMSASAPQGLTSALSSLAGRYNFAPGYQGTPGPATLQSRTQDLLSGGQQGAGAPAGAAGAGDGQAGNAWGWNLKNWNQMAPSMQQGVLGAAEAGGAYGPDIERLLAQAAPRYTGPATAAVGL
jgi:hypothetical protein